MTETVTALTTLTGAPVVYSSSPYMMPGAESIGAMPMMAYTTEMPYPAYSTWDRPVGCGLDFVALPCLIIQYVSYDFEAFLSLA